jgi:hypothetical protein
MKSFIVLLLFCGMFMIVHGVYEQRLEQATAIQKVEYKFVPRTYYDEQLSMESTFGSKLNGIFDNASPWFDNNVGEGLDTMKMDKSSKKMM